MTGQLEVRHQPLLLRLKLVTPVPLNVLYFEDDRDLLYLMELLVGDDVHVVGVASHFLEAVENDSLFPANTVVLLDWLLGGEITGHHVLDKLKEWRPDVPIVIFSAVPSLIPPADIARVQAVLEKPTPMATIEQVLESFI